MKTQWPVILVLSLAFSTAGAHYTKEQIVSYGKSLDVAKLDSSLDSQRLDHWLRSGVHLQTVTWEMSDCDLKGSGAPDYGAPLCVKVRFERGNVGGWIVVQVGTFLEGVKGEPRLEDIVVGSPKGIVPGSHKLSELPRLLDEASPPTGRQ